MAVERVGIVGGGLMGSGIAEVSAKAGIDVIVHEINAELAESALGRVQKSLGRAVERGKLDEAGRDEILGRINVTTDLEEMADRQLVIEAVTEKEQLKKEIFGRLDDIVTDPDAKRTSTLA